MEKRVVFTIGSLCIFSQSDADRVVAWSASLLQGRALDRTARESRGATVRPAVARPAAPGLEISKPIEFKIRNNTEYT